MNSMIDLDGVQHHHAIERLVDVLCRKTQNTDRGFFRVIVAFYFAKIASCQRASVVTKDRGKLPVNMYALNLATSGFGKGFSVNIMEKEVLPGFQDRFMKDTLPIISDANHQRLAQERALRNGTDETTELVDIEGEAKRAGTIPFSFDSGTVPAVKQLRTKLILSGAGSINLHIDEIGSNLIQNEELLNLFLELFDQGMVKGKLTKNTAENTRGEDIEGKTPANLLLFGTPSKLLDGGQTEDKFYSFLDTGYARRCLFGFGRGNQQAYHSQSPAEIYQNLIEQKNDDEITYWNDYFTSLAGPDKFNWEVEVEDDVAIQLLTYKIACEKAAVLLPEHEEIKKAELSHRYFKALKLAGSLAFVDSTLRVTMDQLMSAILLVEESGAAFQQILNREKAHVRLANYLAQAGREVTHADLLDDLPFYPKSNGPRQDMMTLAIAFAYKRHIVITKKFVDGIEFFEGSTLKETNIDELILSTSDNFAYNYNPALLPFSQLPALAATNDGHWCNHYFQGEHRLEDKVIPGFNMIVLDVDGGTTMESVQDLLKEFKFMIYTTKRHDDENHRFRVLLPINYHLELDKVDFKQFMASVRQWLPFPTDEACEQRSKKWLTNDGAHILNDGPELFDALPHIPKTSKNEQHQTEMKKVANLNNLERWFAVRMVTGSRNNELVKFAFALVDSGMSLMDVQQAVHNFNDKLKDSLPKDEIDQTIMRSVAKKFTSH